MLSLKIKDKNALYAAYMPFIKNGGLFIPTDKTYQLGEDVCLQLDLIEEGRLSVEGKVVWITPSGADRAMGIGIQFNDAILRNKIESYLADMLQSDKPTQTM